MEERDHGNGVEKGAGAEIGAVAEENEGAKPLEKPVGAEEVNGV